jgi:hypothetical protein
MSARNAGLAATTVGVLLVVMRSLLDVGDTLGLMMSVGGAIVAAIGVVMVWRTGSG